MKRRLKQQVKSVLEEVKYQLQRPRPKRILFDHLPKCGGTTVTTYLRSHYPEQRTFQINGRNSVKLFKSFPYNIRYKYHLILGHNAHELLDYAPPGTIKLTIFRDPIDRIISYYYYVKQYEHHYLHDSVIKANLSLEDFVSSGLTPEIRNYYTTHFSGLTIEAAEKAPVLAVSTATQFILERYDIIGFLDDLESVMKKVRENAQFKKAFENFIINKTRSKPAFDLIDESVINAIAKINFLDVILYDNLKKEVS